MEWILILERIMDIAQIPSGWLHVTSIVEYFLDRSTVEDFWTGAQENIFGQEHRRIFLDREIAGHWGREPPGFR
ncbi:MAG: hypothetical protein K2M13_00510 [Muribaculaceae bacterium]|nr:hypothetical protein [Muribaculaceae bacterium]